MRSCTRISLAALLAVLAGTGCTTMSLERHTVNQIRSVADHRYRQTLQCLATVAANPASLPSYCLLTAGLTRITDTESVTSTTVWENLFASKTAISVFGFASEALGATVSRSPTEYWTLIPVTQHSQQEALRCACQWVLYGPDPACNGCAGLLASPEQDASPGPHFGVLDRLHRLPPGWLHVGRLKDVPLAARYKAHCGDTWVWVMADGLEGLADFTLALQDIATLDTSNSPPPQVVLTMRWTEPPPVPGSSELTCVESRIVQPYHIPDVTALLFSPGPRDVREVRAKLWDEYTIQAPGRRTNISPTGPNSALRSEISAAPAFPFATSPLVPQRSPFVTGPLQPISP